MSVWRKLSDVDRHDTTRHEEEAWAKRERSRLSHDDMHHPLTPPLLGPQNINNLFRRRHFLKRFNQIYFGIIMNSFYHLTCNKKYIAIESINQVVAHTTMW